MIPLPASSLLAGQLAGCQALQGRGIQFTCDMEIVGVLERFNSPARDEALVVMYSTHSPSGRVLKGAPK